MLMRRAIVASFVWFPVRRATDFGGCAHHLPIGHSALD